MEQIIEDHKSFIPPEQSLPEVTIKGLILAVVLTLVLGAANVFLGLKVGITVSASIPAAVISMGVLSLFRNSNILENNIVQTAASAGEALAAGVIFTMPALVILHYWSGFHYFPSVVIAIVGGCLGVLFSVPLRRVLLAEKILHFPEGTAIANVLMAKETEGSGTKDLLVAGGFGSIITVCQGGFKLLGTGLQQWFSVAGTVVGFGIGFDPALIGAGYIIGINVGLSIFLGVVIGWVVGAPIVGWIYGMPDTTSGFVAVNELWDQYLRYMGLGVMMVGGLYAVSALLKPMIRGIRASFVSVSAMSQEGIPKVLRTEQDMPIMIVLWGILALIIPVFMICTKFALAKGLALPHTTFIFVTFSGLWFVILGGFIIAAICGYFAGLVGSSSNPLSSLALVTLILVSIVLAAILGGQINLRTSDVQSIEAAAIAIVVTAMIACAAAICNDTIQDLKTGYIVGATPWKQQVMLLLGVVVSAFMIPFILQLLFNAYGIAGVFPHDGMDPSQSLQAPQASLMAAIVRGIFTGTMQWQMIAAGAVVALVVIGVERLLRKHDIKLPVLGVGLGIYLPIETSTSLVIGGFLSYAVKVGIQKMLANEANPQRERLMDFGLRKGLLIASGLVAGAAVTGVLLAIPFSIEGNSNALRMVPVSYEAGTDVVGLIVIAGLCYWVKNTILQHLRRLVH